MPAKAERRAPRATGRRPARRHVADARAVALDVLDAVFAPRPRPAEEAFQRHPDLGRLSARDRAFARLLYATVLRRLREIDDRITPLLRHRPSRPTAMNLLRLGLAQLVHLRTPPHAAVAETVRLARDRAPNHAALVNAVLRRLAARGFTPLPEEEAARRNTPPWLWRSWAGAYGEETTLAIARVHLREPPLDLQVKADPEGWARKLEAEILPDGTLRRRGGGPVELLPGYREGAFWVQDVAAALPARLLGEVRGRRVLDLCAAPGGKTAQLCHAGGEVTAVERSPKRAERLEANLARLGFSARILVGDAREADTGDPFPFVLLDAPCTATGTIRRHPDIPWVRQPADVLRMAALQNALLDAAAARLAPGGVLVYAVCSLQPEEGEQRIAAFLHRVSGMERLPVAPDELRGLPAAIDSEGAVRTLPCHLAEAGGMDGFYIARLHRRA